MLTNFTEPGVLADILIVPDHSSWAPRAQAKQFSEKVNSMETKELVAMLMESPFYFDLHVRERLGLVQEHHRRFSKNTKAEKCRIAEVSLGPTIRSNLDKTVTIIMGFIPPNKLSADS